jgi:hypothetical protein
MNSEMGLSSKPRRLMALIGRPHDDRRGARHWARISRRTLHMRVGPSRLALIDVGGIWTRSRIASSANVPETSSVASPIGLPSPHWSSGRAAAPFLFH